jgi:hypothetical protein
LLQDIGRISQPASSEIRLGFGQGGVQGGTIGVVKPIARIQGQKFNLGALGQRRWFIDDKSAVAHPSLDRHGNERSVTSNPSPV